MKLAKTWLVGLGLFFCSTAAAVNPDFNGLQSTSNNANPAFAKAGDVVTFTLQLSAVNDSNGVGQVTFDVGTLTNQVATFPAAGASLNHRANYTVPAGANGSLTVTGLTFTNTLAETLTNAPSLPFAPNPNVTVDTTSPVLSSLSVVSDNADTTKATTGDRLTFTLSLTSPDTWNPGNTLSYQVGAGAPASLPAAFVSTSGTNTKASGSRSVTVVAGANGNVSINTLSFTDRAGNPITGFTTGAPSPNVNVDTTAPAITFTDDVAAGPQQSDDITITVAEADPNLTSFVYGFSPDAVCDATDTFSTAFTSGTPFTFNTEITNGQFICARAQDNSGNVAFLGSSNPLNIDITPPAIQSVSHSGNGNPFFPGFLKAGEKITYAITYTENARVSAINAPSTTTNATGSLTEVSANNTNTDTLVGTVQAGDNGIITPNVNFDLTDAAGNTATITSLGLITGGSAVNTITADTITPTLTSVSISSNNANSSAWAKSGDTITLAFNASERLQNFSVRATILGRNATVTPACVSCTNYTATLITNGSEAEGPIPFTIDFADQASNPGTTVTAVTDASSVVFDTTAPTVPVVSIASNNRFDSALAKSNDTITVTFTVADNLSTTASLSGFPSILNKSANSNVSLVGRGQTISRFTNGTENSEVVAPFRFFVQDEAGNVSPRINQTTDGSSVRFDRTNPLISRSSLSATSLDGSAFTGDVPVFYAKQNDTIDLALEVCDYLDSQTTPPTGTFFTASGLTLTDGGLTGANCLTPEGNTVGVRLWTTQLTNIDGPEGLVNFNITVTDNAGNVLANVASTTDGSSIIFDKTPPVGPTDVVDLGGTQTLGYKPSSHADLYTWTNDADLPGGLPVSGVQNYDVRYQNPSTGIDQQTTVQRQSFAPLAMIPDITPYTLSMNARDKAGNESAMQLVYTQRYGIEISGRVTDAQTQAPIAGAFVNAIAPFADICNNPMQEICSGRTDQNGDYAVVVKPHTPYKVDVIKIPNYYIAKQDLTVTNVDVTTNASLQTVQNLDVQTGKQGTIITLDLPFTLQGLPQTTYVRAYSFSGEVSLVPTAAGIEIRSFGTIVQVDSNNPNLPIINQGNNVYLIKTTAKILGKSDVQNPASSVSSTFASGDNRVGTRRALGGANAGFQAGIKRSERVVNGFATPEESRAFARRLNQGSPYKVMQYVNHNGHTVFAGYQKGRLAIADLPGSDPAVRIQKKIAYRGPRRGTENTFRHVMVEDKKEVIKSLFDLGPEQIEPSTLVVEEGNQQKMARDRVETKKTARMYNNPALSGYGRPVDGLAAVHNKRENDARYVNKFERTVDTSRIKTSRLKTKNVNMIVLRGKGRTGQKMTLGALFQDRPALVNRRERVVKQVD